MAVTVIDIEKDNVMFVQSALDEIEKSHPTAWKVLAEFYYEYAPKVEKKTLVELMKEHKND